ncbi:hypothetical protein JXI42_14460 [bacterium]|nr:hypothetical protein [bacterium]
MGNSNVAEKYKMKKRKGTVILNVIIILAIMFAVVGIMVFLQVKGIKVMGSTRRYFEAFEIAQSGVDYGELMILNAAAEGGGVMDTLISLSDFDCDVSATRMFTSPVIGSNISFGAGYEEIGKGAASGGAQSFYHLEVLAKGQTQGEEVRLEVGFRKIIGVQAK